MGIRGGRKKKESDSRARGWNGMEQNHPRDGTGKTVCVCVAWRAGTMHEQATG